MTEGQPKYNPNKKPIRLVAASIILAGSLIGTGCAPENTFDTTDVLRVTGGDLWPKPGGQNGVGDIPTCIPKEDQDFIMVQSEDLGDGGVWVKVEPVVSDTNCFSGWINSRRLTTTDTNK